MSKLKLLMIAMFALIVGGAAADTAGAASFRLSPAGTITSTSLGKLTFEASGIAIQCAVTLRGTLTSASTAKIAGTQVGSMTSVTINEAACSGGAIETRDVLGLPWPIRYQSIVGTLPERVSGALFTVERASFNLRIFGGFVNCLYSGSPGGLWRLSGSNPYTTGLVSVLATRVPLIRGSFCPEQGNFSGTFAVTTQTLTRL